MKPLELYDEKVSTNILSTIFSDGMVVRADDLDNAMTYPASLVLTLVRAYFGCGIVCGLEVKAIENPSGKLGYCLRIEPGVGIDCEGYPLQLCKPLQVDLTPDPCACEKAPRCLYLAMRRDTVDEAPTKEAEGGDDGKPRFKYRRRRQLVHVKVFRPKQLPEQLCARETASPEGDAVDPCDCLKTCAPCNCCGPSWLLLARIELGDCGVTSVDPALRRYVKPIECRCRPAPRPRGPKGEEEPRPTEPEQGQARKGESEKPEEAEPATALADDEPTGEADGGAAAKARRAKRRAGPPTNG